MKSDPSSAGTGRSVAGVADRNVDHAGGWPNQEQELLLRAALLHGNEALEAWESWSAGIDIDRIDQASTRLLPLLYKNLRAHGVTDPMMGMMKGVYRLAWAKNQVLFRSMAPILVAFHEAGLETLVLKGAALIVQYYREYGLRPTSDFDVLVRTAQAPTAIQLLEKLGLRPVVSMVDVSPSNSAIFSVLHGHSFVGSEGQSLDLHWHVLHDCAYPGADDDFWAGAVPIVIRDVPTLALNPADSLLHLFKHGSLWSSVAPIRWVADAMMILNDSEAQVDWERLLAQARDRQLVVTVREALSYLRRLLDAPMPPDMLHSLMSIPVSRIERIEHRIRLRSRARLGDRFPFLVLRYRRYSRLSSKRMLPGRRLNFLEYCKIVWGVESAWKVPYFAATKVVGRLVRFVLDLGRMGQRKL